MDKQHHSAPTSGAIDPTSCRLIGCDGIFHGEGTCAAVLAEVPLGSKGSLNAELVAYDGEQPHVVIYSFDVGSDETHTRSSDPGTLRATAAQMRSFADAIDTAAALLTPARHVGQADEALRRARMATQAGAR